MLSQWHCHGPWAYHMTAVCGTYPPTISHIISGSEVLSSGPRLSWSTRTSVVEGRLIGEVIAHRAVGPADRRSALDSRV